MTHRTRAFALIAFLAILTPARADNPPKPRKVVFIAGPMDKSHPKGTHEYEKTVLLLKHCLDQSPDAKGVSTEVSLGWPEDVRILDRADAIVLVASGSDRRELDHPLLVGDRLKIVEKQMARGCGLVLLHWATFVPKEKAGDKLLEWVGGYFDYETGPKPQGWYSKIQTVTTEVVPSRTHAIGRGLTPFKVRDEIYYNLRFRESDPRLAPVLTTKLPGEKAEQVIAWAVERKDGGRGFGFTGSHFFDNYRDDSFRRFVLNAVVWAAKSEVPPGGVRSKAPGDDELEKVALSRPVVLVEGRFGKALDARATPVHFDGDNRYRRPPLTVECWAKLFSKKGFNVLIASDPKESSLHWEIYSYAGSGVFSAFLPGTDVGEIRSNVDICDEKWHHVAMTHDGKTVRLFVDGKIVKEQAVGTKAGLKPLPGPLTIGQALASGQRVGCDGLIDDVRISRGVRAIDGVPDKELPFDPETVGLWRFDKPEGLVTGDPLWTPPPPTGPAADWEKMTDKDWIDPRLRAMDTGPTFNATFDYPTWQGKAKVYKGTAIRIGDKGEATVLFDRGQLRMVCGWTGGYLNHSDRRFGLLNTPTPAGEVAFTTSSGPGLSKEGGKWDGAPVPTVPLPIQWGAFNGMSFHGNRVILKYSFDDFLVADEPWVEVGDGLTVFTRNIVTMNVQSAGPPDVGRDLLICELPANGEVATVDGVEIISARKAGLWTAVAFLRDKGDSSLRLVNKTRVEVKANGRRRKEENSFKVLIWHGEAPDLRAFAKRVKASPPPSSDLLSRSNRPLTPRWTKPITTPLELGAENGPFAVDTLTLPFDNPYKALFFVTGLDFLPNGDIAICTAHGDVWLAHVDEMARKVHWKRFATGLYQPLGLKVVGNEIFVLERGQLTSFYHEESDGEADDYQCVCNDWHTGNGEHSFDTCLETDPASNFYFFKTGDTDTPTGGCLLRVMKNGSKSEIFATGFRHPIGLGISPDGMITGADQEGNWMPMTRIDAYQKGGFYGDMRAHHRATPPKIYDPPLLWLPKEADNSAGGQAWVPKGKWGPLSEQMLHLSYGRCKLYLVLPQKVGDTLQAGAVDLGLFFLSGTMRGRFGPDGHLYVGGLNGWQTAARKDGCLQRVRYTGKPLTVPVGMAVHTDGVRLTFAEELDRKTAEDVAKYHVEVWGYRWNADYGSKHWSVVDPNKVGHDPVVVESATLSEDRKSVFLRMKDVKPVMQMSIVYDLQTTAGAKASGTVYNTIHKPAPAAGK